MSAESVSSSFTAGQKSPDAYHGGSQRFQEDSGARSAAAAAGLVPMDSTAPAPAPLSNVASAPKEAAKAAGLVPGFQPVDLRPSTAGANAGIAHAPAPAAAPVPVPAPALAAWAPKSAAEAAGLVPGFLPVNLRPKAAPAPAPHQHSVSAPKQAAENAGLVPGFKPADERSAKTQHSIAAAIVGPNPAATIPAAAPVPAPAPAPVLAPAAVAVPAPALAPAPAAAFVLPKGAPLQEPASKANHTKAALAPKPSLRRPAIVVPDVPTLAPPTGNGAVPKARNAIKRAIAAFTPAAAPAAAPAAQLAPLVAPNLALTPAAVPVPAPANFSAPAAGLPMPYDCHECLSLLPTC